MSSGELSDPDAELVFEECKAFFWRFFTKHVTIVTIKTKTTIARQIMRIRMGFDSRLSLEPEPESRKLDFGMTVR